MNDSGIILVGHQMAGSERIQAQKWHTWKTRNGMAKALTPLHIPESSSLAEAQERTIIWLRERPDVVRRLAVEGWSIHYMPAETGLTFAREGNLVEVRRDGA